MEKKKLIWLILLTISSINLTAQSETISNCKILGISSMADFGSTLDCFNYNTDFAYAPIINVYINAHITASEQNETPAELVQRVRFIIDEANKSLENLQPNFGIPDSRTPWIPKAKIKLKFFSDLAVQPNDQFGGIWVYTNQQPGFIVRKVNGKETLEKDPTEWIFQNRYGSNVLDIVFSNYIYYDSILPLATGRVWRLGGDNVYNTAYIADLNRNVFISNQPGQNSNRLVHLAGVINHEIGHMLSLRHVEDCNNECSNAMPNPRQDSDINTGSECGSRCPETSTCEGYNPGTVTCNDGGRNCTWANSALMMAQGWWLYSVTPCQWNRMFNYVKNNSVNYFKLCHTDTAFVLPTSPQREYRASQQISSTSTIATGRDVDYFAPSIVLNPGFTVALGAQFLAYPALFTCCSDTVIIRDSQLPKENIRDVVHLTEFKVIPNPFGDYIQIDYPIETDFDKVRLIMTDITGKIVNNIPVISQGKGQYQVEVKTNDLPGGIYFIHYQINSGTLSHKMIKAKKN